MSPGQRGHSWVVTWLACSLLNARLAGFTSLWLSFSILSEELALGLGSKERRQREQTLPGWRRVNSGNGQGADEAAISSWPHESLPGCHWVAPFYAAGPTGAQIKG